MHRSDLHLPAGQGAVGLAVATERPGVGERSGGGVGPPRHRRDGRMHIAGYVRMLAVPAVEVDADPVDEPVARPEGGGPQRVEFIEDPRLSLRHSARSVIEPHREPLAGDVRAVLAHLERPGQKRTVVVHPPRLHGRWLRPAAATLRQ